MLDILFLLMATLYYIHRHYIDIANIIFHGHKLCIHIYVHLQHHVHNTILIFLVCCSQMTPHCL